MKWKTDYNTKIQELLKTGHVSLDTLEKEAKESIIAKLIAHYMISKEKAEIIFTTLME